MAHFGFGLGFVIYSNRHFTAGALAAMPLNHPKKTQTISRRTALLSAAALVVSSALPAHAQLRQLRRAIQKNTELAVRRQRLNLRIENSAGPVEALAIGQDGRYMVTVSGDRRARVWDLQRGREIRRQSPIGAAPVAAAFGSDGRRFAIVETNGTLTLWNAEAADPLGAVAVPGSKPSALAFSPDGTTIVVGRTDGSAILLSLNDFSIVKEIAGSGSSATNVDVGTTGQFLLIGAQDGSVRVIEIASGAVVREISATRGSLTDIRFGIDETEFFTADSRGNVTRWRVDSDDSDESYDGAKGGVAAIALSIEGDAVAAVEEEKNLLIWDAEKAGKPLIIEAHPGPIAGVAFDTDSDRVLTFGADGVTRIWSRKEKALLIQLISTERGWAVVDKDGRFDGSSRALSNLSWAGETLDLPIDNFTDNLYEPDLLEKKRLGSGQFLSPGVEKWDEGILPPPLAVIDIEARITQSTLQEIEIDLSIKDEGGGIDGFSLYHNTKLVPAEKIVSREEAEDDDKKVINAIYKVRPVAGTNLFHANATSSEAIVGTTNLVTVDVQAPPRQPVLHVLTVAVNEYLDPALNLNYAIPDAKGIQKIMEAKYGKIFGEVKFYEAYNEKATRRGMQAALTELQETAPEDVVVIYYAGHGEASESDFYFVTYEFELPISSRRLERRALSASKLSKYIENIGARRVIMLIDACKSGTAVEGFRDQMDRRVIRRLGQSVGLHIVSATAKQQFAVEHEELGHGVFTYALIDAMNGAADSEPRDGNLTVREIVQFSEEAVPTLSQQYAQYQHWPLIYSRGLDFTLSTTQ